MIADILTYVLFGGSMMFATTSIILVLSKIFPDDPIIEEEDKNEDIR